MYKPPDKEAVIEIIKDEFIARLEALSKLYPDDASGVYKMIDEILTSLESHFFFDDDVPGDDDDEEEDEELDSEPTRSSEPQDYYISQEDEIILNGPEDQDEAIYFKGTGDDGTITH